MMQYFGGHLTIAIFPFADPHKREEYGGAPVDERGAPRATRKHVPQSQSQPLIGGGARYVHYVPLLCIISVKKWALN